MTRLKFCGNDELRFTVERERHFHLIIRNLKDFDNILEPLIHTLHWLTQIKYELPQTI